MPPATVTDLPADERSALAPAAIDPGLGRIGRFRGLLRAVRAVPTPALFGLSLGLALTLLWRQGSLADVGHAARQASPLTVVAAFALYLAGLVFLCLRWHLLVRMTRGVSDPARAAEAFLTSVVVNYAAPIGLAVPARAALTKRALGLTAAETGAVALWEIAADVVTLGLGTILWLAIGGSTRLLAHDAIGSASLTVTALALAAAIGGAVIAAGLRRPGLRRRARSALVALVRYPRLRPVDATLALAVTLAYWVVQGVVFRLLLGTMGGGTGTSLTLVLGLLGLPVLVGMLSPVPGGAGIREALMVAIARVEHADGAAVLVTAVTYRVALFAAIPVLFLAVRVWLGVRGRGSAVGKPTPARPAADRRPPTAES